MRLSNIFFAAIIAVGTVGCSVGPHYQRPSVALPTQFTAPSTQISPDATGQTPTSDVEFWHNFHDPEMTTLVERALAANNDLRSALAHYDAANALWRLSKFDPLSTVTASEDVGRQRLRCEPGIRLSEELSVFKLHYQRQLGARLLRAHST